MVLATLIAAAEKPQIKFMEAVFKGVWQEQKDAEDTQFLEACISKSTDGMALSDMELDAGMTTLIENTKAAYENQVFGTPTFIHNDQLYFGADRMELLASKL